MIFTWFKNSIFATAVSFMGGLIGCFGLIDLIGIEPIGDVSPLGDIGLMIVGFGILLLGDYFGMKAGERKNRKIQQQIEDGTYVPKKTISYQTKRRIWLVFVAVMVVVVMVHGLVNQ